MSRLHLSIILVIVAVFTGCNSNEGASKRAADRALALQGAPGAFKCKEISAFIPAGNSVEGLACPQHMAVVNGWSELCVMAAQCNTPARLGEINRAAEDFCAEWCAKKQCAYQYIPHSQCDSSWCRNDADCQKNCNVPKLDTCYFQQAAPNYNCRCLEKIDDPTARPKS